MKRHTTSESQCTRRPGDARPAAGWPASALGALGAELGQSVVDALANGGAEHRPRRMPAYAKDIPGGIARDRQGFGTGLHIGAGIGRGGRAR